MWTAYFWIVINLLKDFFSFLQWEQAQKQGNNQVSPANTVGPVCPPVIIANPNPPVDWTPKVPVLVDPETPKPSEIEVKPLKKKLKKKATSSKKKKN